MEAMETIVFVNNLVFVIVASISVFIGLDLKKWSNWLFGLYGFLSGFLFGFLRTGMLLGIQVGVLFTFVVMYGGAMTRLNRQRYNKDAVKTWLSRYGQDKRYSLLARILELLDK
jgi:hypothetical protein